MAKHFYTNSHLLLHSRPSSLPPLVVLYKPRNCIITNADREHSLLCIFHVVFRLNLFS